MDVASGSRRRSARRVALIDADATYRAGLQLLLRDRASIEVVGSYGRVDELAGALEGKTALDVVVVEFVHNGCPLSEALQRVVGWMDRRVLVLSCSVEPGHVYDAVRVAGALGYLAKETEPAAIRRHILAVAGGRDALGDGLKDVLHAEEERRRVWAQLSERERQVLALLAQGRTQRGIAMLLEISTNTVKDYISAIYRKLGAQSAVDATRMAIERGLVVPDGRILDAGPWGPEGPPPPPAGPRSPPRVGSVHPPEGGDGPVPGERAR